MSMKKFFALLFIISLSVFLFLKFYSITAEDKEIIAPIDNKIDKKMQMTQKTYMPSVSIETNLESSNSDSFILLTSLITSILSFLGFIISSYYSLKGHRRDEEIFNLQRERERLEMDKIQAEIRALARGEI